MKSSSNSKECADIYTSIVLSHKISLPLPIDKLFTQIGNVFRLSWELNLLLPCFWALGIVLAHILTQLTQPAGLASFNIGTGRVLYGRGELGSILREDASGPCILPSCYIIFIYAPPQTPKILLHYFVIYFAQEQCSMLKLLEKRYNIHTV